MVYDLRDDIGSKADKESVQVMQHENENHKKAYEQLPTRQELVTRLGLQLEITDKRIQKV